MLDNLTRYVYEVWRCRSVSVAAKKLFISQPALSASIKRAEQELGAPIFNRETLPFSLTAEGRLYIEAVEKMMQIEEEARSSIMDVGAMKSGRLTIGTATHISSFVIPKICEKFREKYPKIDVNIVWSDTESLPELLEKRTVDLIFTSNDTARHSFVTEPLFEERCIIAIKGDYEGIDHLRPYSISYAETVSRSYPPEKAISDLSLFSGIEFIYAPPNSNLYKKRKMFFGESGLSRHVTSNTGRYQLNYNLMLSGFGALFTTDTALATTPPAENCLYFALNSPEATQNFSIVHSAAGDSSPRLIDEFVRVSTELFGNKMPCEMF